MNKSSIVFLHGFPFDSSAWKPQVEHLQGRYEVYAPDLRGHGTARAPDGPWMISHYVSDLEKFLDEKKIAKAILCGLSMGGYIALQFVAKHQDRVEGLVLCDTRADADSNDAKEKRYQSIEKIQRSGVQDFARDFSKSVLSETTIRQRPEIQRQVEAMILDNKSENIVRVLAALASRWDNRAMLSAIHCPTAVFVGADDKVTPPELSEVIAGGIEDSELRIIENAGHLSNLEQPEIFNRFLDGFLEKNFTTRETAASAV